MCRSNSPDHLSAQYATAIHKFLPFQAAIKVGCKVIAELATLVCHVLRCLAPTTIFNTTRMSKCSSCDKSYKSESNGFHRLVSFVL